MSGRRSGRTKEGKEEAVNPFAELRCFGATVMSLKQPRFDFLTALRGCPGSQSLTLCVYFCAAAAALVMPLFLVSGHIGGRLQENSSLFFFFLLPHAIFMTCHHIFFC